MLKENTKQTKHTNITFGGMRYKEKKYYVINGHADGLCLFWKYDDCGYTDDIIDAKEFTEQEASDVVKGMRDPYEKMAVECSYVKDQLVSVVPWHSINMDKRLKVE